MTVYILMTSNTSDTAEGLIVDEILIDDVYMYPFLQSFSIWPAVRLSSITGMLVSSTV